jgi:peptide/nickel transport system permease protein
VIDGPATMLSATAAEEDLPAEQWAVLDAASEERRQSVWSGVIHSRRGQVGLALCGLLVLIVIFGRIVAPYSPTQIGVGPVGAGPSGAHWFGTDTLGRDVFSRVLAGGTLVLVLPLAANVVASLVGGGLALWGVYRRGISDMVITRLFDVLLALPPLLMVLVIISGLGTSMWVILLAMTIFFIPRAGRVLRGASQQIVSEDYVAASEALGERAVAIIWRDILPNMLSPAIADFALRVTYGIIFITTLSFLGLGTQPPKADWGLMVSENQSLLTTNPMAVLGPIIAIALLATSINLIADAISQTLTDKHLDPGASR